MNDQLKSVLLIIGFLLLMALFQWAVGNTQLVPYSLALIPLFFLGWGLSLLLMGRKRREIAKNLTDEERRSLTEMSRSYGWMIGLYFAPPLAFISALVYFAFHESLLAGGISLLAGFIVESPILYRLARPMRDFYFQTEYAKNRFHESELRPN